MPRPNTPVFHPEYWDSFDDHFAALLDQTVQIRRWQSNTLGDQGQSTSTHAAGVATAGRIDQTDAREVTRDRQTAISRWVLYVPATAEIGSRDLVDDAHGRTFEVWGEPFPKHGDRSVYLEVRLVYVKENT